MKTLLNLFLISCIVSSFAKSANCMVEDSTTIEIYKFNDDGGNFTKEIYFGDSLSQDALLLKRINDQISIEAFCRELDRLVKENNFIGNYECFMPNIGLVVSNGGKVIKSINICMNCRKLFYYDYIDGYSGYLFFHNNNILDKFFDENNLWDYIRKF